MYGNGNKIKMKSVVNYTADFICFKVLKILTNCQINGTKLSKGKVILMKYEKSCGAVILDGKKVLVLQQAAGHWGFPKGHVEKGETEVETAKREIKEETGLDVEINENYKYCETYSPAEGIEKEVIYFIANKVGGEIKPQEEEVSQIEWMTYEKALDMLTYTNSKEILKRVWKEYINK